VSALLALILAGSLAAGGACPEFPLDPTLVVPDGASVVLGVDVDSFAQTSTGKALLPALATDLQVAEALEVLGGCGLALERVYALVLARDPGDGRMLAVQARSLGEPATIACLAGKLAARNQGVEPWVREPTACFDSLALADGSRIWIPNIYTLVWTRGSFVEPVAARMTGATPLGLPLGLAAEFDRLDRSRHLWLAAVLSADDRRTLPGVWAREAESLTAAVSLADGVHAELSLGASKAEALANTRSRLLMSFAALSDRLDAHGVEHRLRERARVGIVDGVVAAQVELDEGELRAIRRQIGEHVSGRGPL